LCHQQLIFAADLYVTNEIVLNFMPPANQFSLRIDVLPANQFSLLIYVPLANQFSLSMFRDGLPYQN
jgi:hypothetical protein